MKFRPLGRTGLQLSWLSFGASSLGQEFRPVDVRFVAAEHCSARGVDIAQPALQYSLTHPDLATCVVGSANPEAAEPTPHSAARAGVPAGLAAVLRRALRAARPEQRFPDVTALRDALRPFADAGECGP